MDEYGSDFITIVDDDGNEYELEVLSTLEYNGEIYLAVVPAGESLEQFDLEVSIFKSVEREYKISDKSLISSSPAFLNFSKILWFKLISKTLSALTILSPFD